MRRATRKTARASLVRRATRKTARASLVRRATRKTARTRTGPIGCASATATHTWDDTYNFNEKEFKLHDDSSLGLEFHQRGYDEAEILKKYAGAKEFDIKGKWEQKVRGSVTIRNGKLVDPRFAWEDVAE